MQNEIISVELTEEVRRVLQFWIQSELNRYRVDPPEHFLQLLEAENMGVEISDEHGTAFAYLYNHLFRQIKKAYTEYRATGVQNPILLSEILNRISKEER